MHWKSAYTDEQTYISETAVKRPKYAKKEILWSHITHYAVAVSNYFLLMHDNTTIRLVENVPETEMQKVANIFTWLKSNQICLEHRTTHCSYTENSVDYQDMQKALPGECKKFPKVSLITSLNSLKKCIQQLFREVTHYIKNPSSPSNNKFLSVTNTLIIALERLLIFLI